jgi:prevent-host-death family protein
MSEVKVAELKSKLSAYLAEVRRGETVIVYDRNTPIARLVPFEKETNDIVIIEPTAQPSELRRLKGVRPRKRVDADKLLQELRKDR